MLEFCGEGEIFVLVRLIYFSTSFLIDYPNVGNFMDCIPNVTKFIIALCLK